MLAMLTPSISVQQMVEWIERAARGQPGEAQPAVAADTGGSVSGPEPVLTEDSVRAPGWPRRHLLGSGPELSEQVVMMVYPVQGDASDGAAMTTLGGPRPQFYWRGLTYDQYTGLGWYASETETVEYSAGDLAIWADSVADAPEGRYLRMVRHKVQVVRDSDGLLHGPGILVAADRDYSVAWRSRPGEGDRFAGDAFGAVIRGARYPMAYRVDSWVKFIGEAQLRSAGTAYPEWVRNRYLALPDGMPARVLARARDLTATEPTPYDRALAIETYLRTFPYSLDLPKPPRDQDVVDYFLFDLQQGYCDYYATAMAVLARAAGLPARLVVGYASGTYDEADNRYVVTEADAHSWVEIYFPGYGWIEFEPTSARPTFGRSTDLPAAVPPNFEPLVGPGIGLPGFWWVGLPGMAFLVGLGLACWSVIDGWRLRRLSLKMAAAELYWRLYHSGRRLSVPMRPGDTPYEFVASLAEWVTRRLEGMRWAAPLSPITREARWLVELYVRSCYARGTPDATDLKLAMQIWRRLQRRLWLVRIWGLVGRLMPFQRVR
jgi:transglutaminase-like putative cysteine protease